MIAANLKSLGIESRFRILKSGVTKAIGELESQKVTADVVFLDPPYRMREEYGATLIALSGSTLLQPKTTVVAEHEKMFDPGNVYGTFRRSRTLLQGDAGLSFYHRT